GAGRARGWLGPRAAGRVHRELRRPREARYRRVRDQVARRDPGDRGRDRRARILRRHPAVHGAAVGGSYGSPDRSGRPPLAGTPHRAVEDRVCSGQLSRREGAVPGLPLGDGAEPVLDRQHLARRTIQPGGEADPLASASASGGTPSRADGNRWSTVRPSDAARNVAFQIRVAVRRAIKGRSAVLRTAPRTARASLARRPWVSPRTSPGAAPCPPRIRKARTRRVLRRSLETGTG